MTDSEIVELFWKRSEDAIAETNTKYHRYIYGIAYNILKDAGDCEETENDTYLSAWNSMPDQRPVALMPYLGKIARNIALNIYRRSHAQKRQHSNYQSGFDEIQELIGGTDTPDANLVASELDQSVNRFLGSLDKEQQQLFIGRYFYFDSIKDICSYTGLSESNVKTKLYRVRKKLKEELEKEGYICEN